MNYFEAESMRQEIHVAMQYKDILPNNYKDVIRKYTSEQWVECGKAILEKLENDKINLFELLQIVELVKKLN